ncbi:hypothetical protein CEF21_14255 [Bacillus sp. FJAT-42376]|uniref:helix-turn-helix domain-containing protein n=1 Tax=Bacillus sp. FJAT-42376 TaxID=2014076 RepID=UPI000F4F171B|nr:helix-turn-helix domain-containing protein [Bacillus sp. FJAT-42376]AZB43372.1 hypothetical protein CEF21_14255 [Bacillus sp. FJAT-42376]
MIVTGYSYISLLCLDRFNGERSFSAIYHLLRGKKTSQTLQDMQLFELTGFFSLFPQISRDKIEEACKSLKMEGLINEKGILTGQGKEVLKKNLSIMPVPSELNSWKFGKEAREAWTKLSLLVQTITHLIHKQSRFLPITADDEAQLWVKKFVLSSNVSKSELSSRLYKELELFLSDKEDFLAELFVFRLTTPSRAGLTYMQLEDRLDRDSVYLEICFWGLMHGLLERCTSETFPLLSMLKTEEQSYALPLTQSAKRTHRLLLQGIDKESAGRIRNLKQSTIEDHIVEIAMHDAHFDLTPYILPSEKEEILLAVRQLKTKQLKKIKDHLDGNYSYFQIRLGMAGAKR